MKRNSSGRTGLARALSKLGYCSRTAAWKLIADSGVRLNGVVCRDPGKPVALGRDRIEVDGQQVRNAKKIYLMMNKPRGIVTTASDEKGRETVYSLFPDDGRWLAPVGRLDKASEGLLLFTNDSEWAARITAPESHVAKTYHVQVRTEPNAALLAALAEGIRESGELLKASRARVIRQGEKDFLFVTVSSRTAPFGRSPSSSPPIATRTSRETSIPSAANIRRICRFLPWCG